MVIGFSVKLPDGKTALRHDELTFARARTQFVLAALGLSSDPQIVHNTKNARKRLYLDSPSAGEQR